MYYNDELYHHGVKGMKWGKHLFSGLYGSLSKIKTKAAETKYKVQAKAKGPISNVKLEAYGGYYE